MNQLYDVLILDMSESHKCVISDSEQESILEQPTMHTEYEPTHFLFFLSKSHKWWWLVFSW